MVRSRVPNDCVVIALANYTGASYDEVLEVLEKVRGPRAHGEGIGLGYYKETWLFALRCLLNRAPRRATLLSHSLVRFDTIVDRNVVGGHVVLLHEDGTVIDGALRIPNGYTLERYLKAYPNYAIESVWR